MLGLGLRVRVFSVLDVFEEVFCLLGSGFRVRVFSGLKGSEYVF